ncbi:MAG: hypothetical protein HY696_03785 [Deltaproteobacteria bacterium]|nr:hypothetical protein [Deltaproteobacteria bacterium]
MDQLKKALQKAGFTTSDQLKTKERPRKAIKLDDERKGHEIRNQCDLCDKFASNIEHYEHRVGVLNGKKWLCLKCADEHRINDETRTTHQSPLARSGLFLREYGRTRKF